MSPKKAFLSFCFSFDLSQHSTRVCPRVCCQVRSSTLTSSTCISLASRGRRTNCATWWPNTGISSALCVCSQHTNQTPAIESSLCLFEILPLCIWCFCAPLKLWDDLFDAQCSTNKILRSSYHSTLSSRLDLCVVCWPCASAAPGWSSATGRLAARPSLSSLTSSQGATFTPWMCPTGKFPRPLCTTAPPTSPTQPKQKEHSECIHAWMDEPSCRARS